MQDILKTIEEWREAGEDIALATVVKTTGPAPRFEGSKMAITRSGKLVGSVSGGCVEGAVFEEAQKVLKSRKPKLLKYGISKETAWDVGLACGGGIEVYLTPLE
ncbi:MAG: XdhC family protein [Chloroflexi bacterium]|uniref:XdhC family protein n=1 Tax=Candidatus Chlorohelix allophototropha TaxID=3003348 RepID=A0A8T7M2A7_9CHLR|nr:XdhC family protein [Chloroflexota bacterium]WJW65731.1 XdhC family protein [Chloroflexota bacterium L227-S17]